MKYACCASMTCLPPLTRSLLAPQIYNKVKEYTFKYMPTCDLLDWTQAEQNNNASELVRLDFDFVQSAVFNILLTKTPGGCANRRVVEPLLRQVSLAAPPLALPLVLPLALPATNAAHAARVARVARAARAARCCG